MWTFPFISRSSHEAIVAAQREQTELLRTQLEAANAREEMWRAERAAFDEKLIEAMRPKMPAMRPRRLTEAEDGPQRSQPETLDLSMVDPNDNEALKLIVLREMPAGARTTAPAFLRSIERLREQVVEARQARNQKAVTPLFVPERINSRIDGALAAGRDAAQGAA
jgi:hypothetical protein